MNTMNIDHELPPPSATDNPPNHHSAFDLVREYLNTYEIVAIVFSGFHKNSNSPQIDPRERSSICPPAAPLKDWEISLELNEEEFLEFQQTQSLPKLVANVKFGNEILNRKSFLKRPENSYRKSEVTISALFSSPKLKNDTFVSQEKLVELGISEDWEALEKIIFELEKMEILPAKLNVASEFRQIFSECKFLATEPILSARSIYFRFVYRNDNSINLNLKQTKSDQQEPLVLGDTRPKLEKSTEKKKRTEIGTDNRAEHFSNIEFLIPFLENLSKNSEQFFEIFELIVNHKDFEKWLNKGNTNTGFWDSEILKNLAQNTSLAADKVRQNMVPKLLNFSIQSKTFWPEVLGFLFQIEAAGGPSFHLKQFYHSLHAESEKTAFLTDLLKNWPNSSKSQNQILASILTLDLDVNMSTLKGKITNFLNIWDNHPNTQISILFDALKLSYSDLEIQKNGTIYFILGDHFTEEQKIRKLVDSLASFLVTTLNPPKFSFSYLSGPRFRNEWSPKFIDKLFVLTKMAGFKQGFPPQAAIVCKIIVFEEIKKLGLANDSQINSSIFDESDARFWRSFFIIFQENSNDEFIQVCQKLFDNWLTDLLNLKIKPIDAVRLLAKAEGLGYFISLEKTFNFGMKSNKFESKKLEIILKNLARVENVLDIFSQVFFYTKEDQNFKELIQNFSTEFSDALGSNLGEIEKFFFLGEAFCPILTSYNSANSPIFQNMDDFQDRLAQEITQFRLKNKNKNFRATDAERIICKFYDNLDQIVPDSALGKLIEKLVTLHDQKKRNQPKIPSIPNKFWKFQATIFLANEVNQIFEQKIDEDQLTLLTDIFGQLSQNTACSKEIPIDEMMKKLGGIYLNFQNFLDNFRRMSQVVYLIRRRNIFAIKFQNENPKNSDTDPHFKAKCAKVEVELNYLFQTIRQQIKKQEFDNLSQKLMDAFNSIWELFNDENFTQSLDSLTKESGIFFDLFFADNDGLRFGEFRLINLMSENSVANIVQDDNGLNLEIYHFKQNRLNIEFFTPEKIKNIAKSISPAYNLSKDVFVRDQSDQKKFKKICSFFRKLDNFGQSLSPRIHLKSQAKNIPNFDSLESIMENVEKSTVIWDDPFFQTIFRKNYEHYWTMLGNSDEKKLPNLAQRELNLIFLQKFLRYLGVQEESIKFGKSECGVENQLFFTKNEQIPPQSSLELAFILTTQNMSWPRMQMLGWLIFDQKYSHFQTKFDFDKMNKFSSQAILIDLSKYAKNTKPIEVVLAILAQFQGGPFPPASSYLVCGPNTPLGYVTKFIENSLKLSDLWPAFLIKPDEFDVDVQFELIGYFRDRLKMGVPKRLVVVVGCCHGPLGHYLARRSFLNELRFDISVSLEQIGEAVACEPILVTSGRSCEGKSTWIYNEAEKVSGVPPTHIRLSDTLDVNILEHELFTDVQAPHALHIDIGWTDPTNIEILDWFLFGLLTQGCFKRQNDAIFLSKKTKIFIEMESSETHDLVAKLSSLRLINRKHHINVDRSEIQAASVLGKQLMYLVDGEPTIRGNPAQENRQYQVPKISLTDANERLNSTLPNILDLNRTSFQKLRQIGNIFDFINFGVLANLKNNSSILTEDCLKWLTRVTLRSAKFFAVNSQKIEYSTGPCSVRISGEFLTDLEKISWSSVLEPIIFPLGKSIILINNDTVDPKRLEELNLCFQDLKVVTCNSTPGELFQTLTNFGQKIHEFYICPCCKSINHSAQISLGGIQTPLDNSSLQKWASSNSSHNRAEMAYDQQDDLGFLKKSASVISDSFGMGEPGFTFADRLSQNWQPRTLSPPNCFKCGQKTVHSGLHQEAESIEDLTGHLSEFFVLNPDNFLKMAAIIVRTQARLPVVIFGEAGSGKTALVRFLGRNVLGRSFEIVRLNFGISVGELLGHVGDLVKRCQEAPNDRHLLVFDDFTQTQHIGLLKTILVDRLYRSQYLPQNGVVIGIYSTHATFGPEFGARIPQSLKAHTLDFGSLSANEFELYLPTKMAVCGTKNEEPDVLTAIQKLHEKFLLFPKTIPNLVSNHLKKLGLDLLFRRRFFENISSPKLVKFHNFLISRIVKSGILELKTFGGQKLYELFFLRPKIWQNLTLLQDAKCSKLSFFARQYQRLLLPEDQTHYRDSLRKLIEASTHEQLTAASEKMESILANAKKSIFRNLWSFEFYKRIRQFLATKYFQVEGTCLPGAPSNFPDIVAFLMCFYFQRAVQAERKIVLHVLARQTGKPPSDILSLFESVVDNFISQFDLPAHIVANAALSENVFLVSVCLLSQTPLLIVGQPGSSKTEAISLVLKAFQGQQSKNPFFKNFPKLSPVQLQEINFDSQKKFKPLLEMDKNSENKNFDEQNIIQVCIFDNFDCSDQDEDFQRKLFEISESEYQKYGYVCVCNRLAKNSLKMHRFIVLCRLEPELKDLEKTVHQTISKIGQNMIPVAQFQEKLSLGKIVELIAEAYFETRQISKNSDCLELFGLREFYRYTHQIVSQINSIDFERLSWQDVAESVSIILMESSWRNFSVLKEATIQICKKIIRWFQETTGTNQALTIPKFDVDLFLRPHSDEFASRNLLVVTDVPIFPEIVQTYLESYLPIFASSNFLTIHGPIFDSDENNLELIDRVLDQLGEALGQEATLLLYNMHKTCAKLANLFDRKFVHIGNSKFVDLSGSKFEKKLVRVHPKCKMVFVVSQKELPHVSQFLLSRLEKVRITNNELFDPKHLYMAKQLLSRLQALNFSTGQSKSSYQQILPNFCEIQRFIWGQRLQKIFEDNEYGQTKSCNEILNDFFLQTASVQLISALGKVHAQCWATFQKNEFFKTKNSTIFDFLVKISSSPSPIALHVIHTYSPANTPLLSVKFQLRDSSNLGLKQLNSASLIELTLPDQPTQLEFKRILATYFSNPQKIPILVLKVSAKIHAKYLPGIFYILERQATFQAQFFAQNIIVIIFHQKSETSDGDPVIVPPNWTETTFDLLYTLPAECNRSPPTSQIQISSVQLPESGPCQTNQKMAEAAGDQQSMNPPVHQNAPNLIDFSNSAFSHIPKNIPWQQNSETSRIPNEDPIDVSVQNQDSEKQNSSLGPALPQTGILEQMFKKKDLHTFEKHSLGPAIAGQSEKLWATFYYLQKSPDYYSMQYWGDLGQNLIIKKIKISTDLAVSRESLYAVIFPQFHEILRFSKIFEYLKENRVLAKQAQIFFQNRSLQLIKNQNPSMDGSVSTGKMGDGFLNLLTVYFKIYFEIVWECPKNFWRNLTHTSTKIMNVIVRSFLSNDLEIPFAIILITSLSNITNLDEKFIEISPQEKIKNQLLPESPNQNNPASIPLFSEKPNFPPSSDNQNPDSIFEAFVKKNKLGTAGMSNLMDELNRDPNSGLQNMLGLVPGFVQPTPSNSIGRQKSEGDRSPPQGNFQSIESCPLNNLLAPKKAKYRYFQRYAIFVIHKFLRAAETSINKFLNMVDQSTDLAVLKNDLEICASVQRQIQKRYPDDEIVDEQSSVFFWNGLFESFWDLPEGQTLIRHCLIKERKLPELNGKSTVWYLKAVANLEDAVPESSGNSEPIIRKINQFELRLMIKELIKSFDCQRGYISKPPLSEIVSRIDTHPSLNHHATELVNFIHQMNTLPASLFRLPSPPIHQKNNFPAYFFRLPSHPERSYAIMQSGIEQFVGQIVIKKSKVWQKLLMAAAKREFAETLQKLNENSSTIQEFLFELSKVATSGPNVYISAQWLSSLALTGAVAELTAIKIDCPKMSSLKESFLNECQQNRATSLTFQVLLLILVKREKKLRFWSLDCFFELLQEKWIRKFLDPFIQNEIQQLQLSKSKNLGEDLRILVRRNYNKPQQFLERISDYLGPEPKSSNLRLFYLDMVREFLVDRDINPELKLAISEYFSSENSTSKSHSQLECVLGSRGWKFIQKILKFDCNILREFSKTSPQLVEPTMTVVAIFLSQKNCENWLSSLLYSNRRDTEDEHLTASLKNLTIYLNDHPLEKQFETLAQFRFDTPDRYVLKCSADCPFLVLPSHLSDNQITDSEYSFDCPMCGKNRPVSFWRPESLPNPRVLALRKSAAKESLMQTLGATFRTGYTYSFAAFFRYRHSPLLTVFLSLLMALLILGLFITGLVPEVLIQTALGSEFTKESLLTRIRKNMENIGSLSGEPPLIFFQKILLEFGEKSCFFSSIDAGPSHPDLMARRIELELFDDFCKNVKKNLKRKSIQLRLFEQAELINSEFIEVLNQNEPADPKKFPHFQNLINLPASINLESFRRRFFERSEMFGHRQDFPYIRQIMEGLTFLRKGQVVLKFKNFYQQFARHFDGHLSRIQASQLTIAGLMNLEPQLGDLALAFADAWEAQTDAGEFRLKSWQKEPNSLGNQGVYLIHILPDQQTQGQFLVYDAMREFLMLLNRLAKPLQAGTILPSTWDTFDANTLPIIDPEVLENLVAQTISGSASSELDDLDWLEETLRSQLSAFGQFVDNQNLIPSFNYAFEVRDLAQIFRNLEISFPQKYWNSPNRSAVCDEFRKICQKASDEEIGKFHKYLWSQLLPQCSLIIPENSDQTIAQLLENKTENVIPNGWLSDVIHKLLPINLKSFYLAIEKIILENRVKKYGTIWPWKEIQKNKNLGEIARKLVDQLANKNPLGPEIFVEILGLMVHRFYLKIDTPLGSLEWHLSHQTLAEPETEYCVSPQILSIFADIHSLYSVDLLKELNDLTQNLARSPGEKVNQYLPK